MTNDAEKARFLCMSGLLIIRIQFNPAVCFGRGVTFDNFKERCNLPSRLRKQRLTNQVMPLHVIDFIHLLNRNKDIAVSGSLMILCINKKRCFQNKVHESADC